MTKEEAIRILASSCIPGSKQTEALETLIPELKESEDKRMMREFNDWLCEEIECLQNDLRDEEDRKTLNMLCYVLTKVKDWLEKQKEVGIQWLKSDNVKNPDKPYIDKAGMFYTTDGRMCYASEIEKQKEHQELPLMNGDADLYFDTWRQEVPVPTFRQCFEEGMRYAQRLQKEQKQVDYEAELKKCKDNPLYFYDKYVSIKQKPAEWKATLNGESIPTENQSVEIPLAEWSDDDSDNLERVENYLWMLDDYVGDDCTMPQGKTDKIRENIQEILLPWFKSLPKRFNLQSKQEWSEEDRLHYANVLEALEYVKGCKSDYDKIEAVKSDIAWFKSLKPHWRPSEKYAKNKDFSDCLTELACELYECHDESDSPEDTSIKEYHVLEKWEPILLKKAQIWKPSEEDIKMLEHIIGQYETGNKNSKIMGYLPRIEELNFLKKVLAKWKNLL